MDSNMKEREPREDDNLARLVRAAFEPTARPKPESRRRVWEHIASIWRSEYAAHREQQPADEASAQLRFPDAVAVTGQGARERTNRINNNQYERSTFMSRLFKNRWGVGLGALGATAAAVVMITLLSPRAQAKAADVMARGARAVANLTTIHLRGQLRTVPHNEFSLIQAGADFHPIELWKQFGPELKWRVEKPGRVAVMDGQSAVLYIKPGNIAAKITHSTPAAFDTDWLHNIADLSNTISNELWRAQARGWQMEVTETNGTDGKRKTVVTIHAKSGIPESDHERNIFFDTADTRRVYQFDAQSERLEAVQIVQVLGANETKIFDLSQSEYNQPIEPSVWQLALPADASWYQEPQKLPDNEKYAALTVEQAARAFLEACARKDWEEAGKFISPLDESFKETYGGLEILALGKTFTSQTYNGVFVPYEIKLPSQTFNARLDNTNSAKRFVITGFYDRQFKLQEELNWSTQPPALPDNDTYAKLTPAEVAQATFDALAKLDFAEMRKYLPEAQVKDLERLVAEAKKKGKDISTQIPVFQAGEAFWSPEQSAWFVKCTVGPEVKKSRLAIRKSNPAGRWEVTGGY